MIVAFAPGGGTDAAARTIARFMERDLGQPVVVLNRPGAGGEIGFSELARARPDGYTIGFINTPTIVTIPIERRARFGLGDFALIANIVDDPGGIWVLNDTPIRDFQGLLAAAHRDTLFLDEVGELPMPLQAKLLNVLERRVVRRIGATKERPVAARFIAATNRNLQEMVLENRFRAGEEIFPVRVDVKEMQFLYEEGNALVCMDTETYDQILVDKILFGDSISFLKEGMNLKISFDDQMPLLGELPATVELEVTYTEPGIRGDTATRTLKPATVETGATVNIPLFVETGEKIRVNTQTGEYMERVK
jgi:elongation factor P